MRPNTTEDVFELLDGYAVAAALGTAMELGIFWLLAGNPMPAQDIAQRLNIPLNRCQRWLQLLGKLGLLEKGSRGYAPTATARKTIVDALSQDTWAFLAHGVREETPAVKDLAEHIHKPQSLWEIQQLTPPDYLKQIQEDADYAARFTRMLYEIHLPLAAQLAEMLNLEGVERLLDLGGGSGVISQALLRKNPGLSAVVIDQEHVCPVGREIARENQLEERISYLVADFVEDDLPSEFDLVLLCDVGAPTEAVLRKIHAALDADGRLILVYKYAPDGETAVPSRLVWAFLGSLENSGETSHLITVGQMQARLEQAGFKDVTVRDVPAVDGLRWNVEWTVLEARKLWLS